MSIYRVYQKPVADELQRELTAMFGPPGGNDWDVTEKHDRQPYAPDDPSESDDYWEFDLKSKRAQIYGKLRLSK